MLLKRDLPQQGEEGRKRNMKLGYISAYLLPILVFSEKESQLRYANNKYVFIGMCFCQEISFMFTILKHSYFDMFAFKFASINMSLNTITLMTLTRILLTLLYITFEGIFYP
jgi:hypothetical protein